MLCKNHSVAVVIFIDIHCLHLLLVIVWPLNGVLYLYFKSSIVLLYFWGLALTRRNTLNSPSSPKRGKKN